MRPLARRVHLIKGSGDLRVLSLYACFLELIFRQTISEDDQLSRQSVSLFQVLE